MRIATYWVTGALLSLCLFLTGCLSCGLKQDPDALRQKTAETTANLKTDAKAVAQGIKEGLGRDTRVDINAASEKELTALPGVTPRVANRIVENRPYDNPQELVTKRVLRQEAYDKIKSQVTAKK